MGLRIVLVGVGLLSFGTGCSKIAGLIGGNKDADAGAAVDTGDAAPQAAADPAAAAEKKPVNEAAVKRYPNEKTLGGETSTVSARAANAMEGHPGDIIAVLQQGTAVKRVAEHEGFVLVSFANPADANERMLGWVTKSAVAPPGSVVAATVVKTDAGVAKSDAGTKDAGVVQTACPAGESRFFGEADFCAQKCGTPSDKACAAGSACLGSAPLSENGAASKTVARFCIHMSGTLAVSTDAGTTTITPVVHDAGAPVVTVTDAGALTIAKPLMMKAVGTICLPGYAYANDKFCRLSCKADADCPTSTFCVDRYGPKVCSSTK
ncbi:MAG: hypothetical protein U0169_09360 [Polyangiaceae bacterium]